jgi:hypothetical protein
MAKILLRKSCQVSFDDFQMYYRIVEVNNATLDDLINNNWSVYGCEDAPQQIVEAKPEQPTTTQGQNAQSRASAIA